LNAASHEPRPSSPLRALTAVFVHNPVFANLLALGTLVGGAVAAFHLPRETFPETSLNYFLVTVTYPGGAPADVEEGICIKVEQAVEGIPGVWDLASRADDNIAYIGAAFDPEVTPTAEVLRQVTNRVNAITTFPPAAGKPVVTEVIVHNDVITIGVHGDAPESVIQRTAERVREDLLAHTAISQVRLIGVRESELSIQVTEEALLRHGLSMPQLVEMISRSNLNLPAGTVRTGYEEFAVRTTGRGFSVRDFENLVIIAHPDGTSVRLGQIAQVRETFEETPLYGRINGEPGILVRALKTPLEDISSVAAAARDYVARAQAGLPEGVRLTLLVDKSRDVDARVDMLVKNGLMGIVLLMGCLLLFMDFRAAVGVAMGLPVAMAGALLVMHLTGQTLNLISLFGIIMADAIVLDDSIVIADSVLAREREGLSPALAAIEGTGHVALPVIHASLTTLIMFVPMMFVEGVMGKLIYVLPVVVIASIAASLAEAFVVLPAHLCEWAGWQKRSGGLTLRARIRSRLDGWIQTAIGRGYRPVIESLIRWRLVVLAGSAGALCVCIGLVLGGRTPFILFPKMDCNTLRARVRFPEGTPVEVTQAAADRIEQAALALNDDAQVKPAMAAKLVRHVYSSIGEWPDYYVPTRSSGLCETTIELLPAEDRRLDVALILERWRNNIGPIATAQSLSIVREELGPTDKPIEIRLLGDDLHELRAAADALEENLGSFAGVFDIEDDLIYGKRELQISLKPAARHLGLTVGDLAMQLRQALYGGEAVRLQRGNEELRVMVEYAQEGRQNFDTLDHLHIRTHSGATVPFHEVAEGRFVRGFSGIVRQDGHRRVRVQADVDERFANAEQIVRNLESSFLAEMPERFPGIRVLIDGQRKRIQESLASLTAAALICLILTYVVLGAGLKSYVQPLILMTAVPLGLAGAVAGHTILGYDLSLMSVFGMTSVAGIVVNDSLVLVDQVNRNLAGGMKVHEAVTRGSESRVIAVFLTAITNVAGMAPLLAERSSQAVTLIPIAISVAFGLCFATVLTLFIVPALYLAVNDVRRFVYWLRVGGLFPAPEVVEPSCSPALVPAV